MPASPIHIEQTPAGKIRLAHNGRLHEVTDVESALHLLASMLAPAREVGSRRRVQPATHGARASVVRSLAGKYRDVLTPTSERAAQKRQEIELEERKLRERDV